MTRSFFFSLIAFLPVLAAAQFTQPDPLSPAVPYAAPQPVAVPEIPPPVSASSLISPDLLSGPNYKVSPDVDRTGMLYRFDITTDNGPLTAGSLQMMRIRLAELKAIHRLGQLSEEELYLKGVGEQLETTARATGKALRNPIQTIKSVPDGFKKFAGQLQAQQIVGQVYGESGSTTYAQVKRELAAKLGVDPYTDNQVLQALMNEVAKNQNRGQLIASIGTFMVGGGAGLALNAVEMNQEFHDLIRKKSAAQLQLDNREILKGMGLTEKRADYFLTTEGYTASNCTAIVRALATLRKIKGVTGVLDTLPKFSGQPEPILFAQTQIQMAAQFHVKVRPLTAVKFVSGTAVWSDATGTSYVFSPIEYLYWTEEIGVGMSNIRSQVSNAGALEYWISGTVSDTARSLLAARGVTVKENSLERLW